MAESIIRQRILIVGEQVDPDDIEAICGGGYSLEYVDTLDDALQKLASGNIFGLIISSTEMAAQVGFRQDGELPAPIVIPPPLLEIRRQMELLDRSVTYTEAHLAYLDPGFNFVWVNSTYAEKCGHSKSDLIGRNHFEFFPNEENRAIFEKVRDSGEPYEVKEAAFVYPEHPERGVTYWNWTLTPVKSRSSVVEGLVLSLVDVTEDATARRHVEAEHRQFHAVLQHMPAGVIIAEAPSGRILLANEQVERIWRQKFPVAEDIEDYQLYAGFHPETGRPYEPEEWPLARAITNRETIEGEMIEFLRGDGTCGTMRVNATPICDEAGTIVAGVAVFEDITEQRQAEDELKRYQLFSEHARDIILFIRRDGQILEANTAAVEAYGYEREELLQKRIYDLRAAETAVDVESQMGMADSESILFETRHRRKDGTVFPVEVSSQGATIAGDRVLLSIIRDITERKHVEQELTKSHAETQRRAAELESFMSSLADGLALVDTNGKILLLNQAGREILGLGPDDALESLEDLASKFRLFTLAGEPQGLADMASYRALQGETVRDLRYKMVSPSGKEILVGVSAAPVRDWEGRIVGATNVFRDEQDRVRFEQKQRELYEREHRIADVLQKALVPDTSYDIPCCSIAVRYQSALEEAEVGGDFYDVFELGEGKVGIMIGDVAGKGLPAAIRVAAARHTIRSYAYLDPSPHKVLTLANDALSKDPTDGTNLLTALFAVLDTNTGEMYYANGGHEPPVMRRADGSIEQLEITGRALGVQEGFQYDQDVRRLQEGDVVVAVTDGITEARNVEREFFGMEGVKAYLSGGERAGCEAIGDGLLAAAKDYARGHLRDDAAIVVVGLKTDSVEQEAV